MYSNLLNRFLNYVRIPTYSNGESTTTPSTTMQFDLAHAIEKEMQSLGMSGVYVDEHCYVYGFVPASKGCEDVPAIGFIAHMDTVDDCGTKPVNPLVHENYDGGDILLNGGTVISPKNFAHLARMKGRTIITADGTTVLGADDKAGIAEIMTLAEQLLNTDMPHGKVSVCFTPDEEIGSGAALLDLERFGAPVGYTLDGDLEGTIEYENFNAASAKITVKGVNVHPGSAKDIMINAAAVAAEFQGRLPALEQPRYTEGYEGFFHLVHMEGSVDQAQMVYIIRDHDKDSFKHRKALICEIADKLNEKYASGTVTAEVKDSYYNMAEIIRDHMDLITGAENAIRAVGLTPVTSPVRGGTDGACLSYRGLPCPNMGTGGYGFHGPMEHISLEGMELTVSILLQIVKNRAEKNA